MKNPFSVSAETLAALSAEDAQDLVRRMIAAEADSAGVRLDQIYCGGRRQSSAGHIDFEVRDAPRESAGGLIRQGQTLYAVRSGRFSARRDMRRMLFKDGGGGDVRDPIRDCIGGGGTLAVILTEGSGGGAAGPDLEEGFARELRGRVPHAGAPVAVWDPARISVLLGRHTHLAVAVNSVPTEGLCTHAMWSRHDDMSRAFRPGRGENEFVRRLRDVLLGGGDMHVRVTGAPGSGKTRLVLEATRDSMLRGRVVYAEGPDYVWPLLSRPGRGGGSGGGACPIIVVDDCDYREQARIWNVVKGSNAARLVTIHSEDVDCGSDSVHMPVPPLADEQVREILSTYVGAEPDLGRWCGYCRASPRAAHVVGNNLRHNPDSMLVSPDTVAVWWRYISGQNGLGEAEFKRRRMVLEWLSLFKTFGYGDAYGREFDRLASLVEKNAGISSDKLASTIRSLRRMKVLQGTSMLYITPKLLHIHLWVEWWKIHTSSSAPKADDLLGSGEGPGGSRDMLRWYLDMFRYAKISPESSKVVKSMMRQGGYLDSGEMRGWLGEGFFGPQDQ